MRRRALVAAVSCTEPARRLMRPAGLADALTAVFRGAERSDADAARDRGPAAAPFGGAADRGIPTATEKGFLARSTREPQWRLPFLVAPLLDGLTNAAMSEFRRGAEAEADRFHRECLLALRDDVTALAGP